MPAAAPVPGVCPHWLASEQHGAAVFAELGDALRRRGLLWLRTADGIAPAARELSPAQIRRLYTRLHAAAYPTVELEPPRTVDRDSSTNLRGVSFPGFPETHCLGSVPGVVEDWHGLTGTLTPTGHWERENGQVRTAAPRPPGAGVGAPRRRPELTRPRPCAPSPAGSGTTTAPSPRARRRRPS